MSVARTPRLRMFAGPNGSGKSTIKAYVGRYLSEELFGHYINPDEFESAIRQSGHLDFKQFNLEVEEVEVHDFFRRSAWLTNVGLADAAAQLRFGANRLDFSGGEVNSYLASVASDFVRRKLLLSRQTFTFETVMSSAPTSTTWRPKTRPSTSHASRTASGPAATTSPRTRSPPAITVP